MTFYHVVLMWHLVVIAMGVGMTFSNWWNNHLAQNNGDEFQKGLGLQRRGIGKIGDGVITFIWLSGALLLVLRGLGGLGVAFGLKMACVVGITFCHARARGMGERMFREGHRSLLKDQGFMMLGGWLLASLAIVCAIVAFRT